MASAQDIRRRIKSVKNTQQITKAMKMVAAAKLRRAQEAVVSARPFATKIREVLGRVAAASAGASHPLLEAREVKKTCYVVISADRGLCGGFNANVLRKAANSVKDIKSTAIVGVGRKSRDFFNRRGFDIAASFVGLGENIQFFQAKEIAKFVVDKYMAGDFDEVYLVYSEFVNVLTQRPVAVKLLPVESPADESKGPKVEYIFEPSAEAVLAELLPTYVETTVFRAMLEAKAGEQGARMTAMDSATKNAKDMINKLTLSLNRARQAAITKEISEIVGGAAALE